MTLLCSSLLKGEEARITKALGEVCAEGPGLAQGKSAIV